MRCALHHLIKAPLLQQVCLVEGQLSGQRLAQCSEMGNFIVGTGATYCSPDVVPLCEQLMDQLSRHVACFQPSVSSQGKCRVSECNLQRIGLLQASKPSGKHLMLRT